MEAVRRTLMIVSEANTSGSGLQSPDSGLAPMTDPLPEPCTAPPGQSPPEYPAGWWGYTAAGTLILLSVAFLRFPTDIAHAVAMYLYAGKLILRGYVPYVDVIDLNPPLIMYLCVPAAWISEHTGLPPGTTFHLATVLAIWVSGRQIVKI